MMKDFLKIEGNKVVACDKNVCGKVVVPEGISAIGKEAFRDCKDITEVELPKGIKSIGAYSFRGCEKLEGINYPTALTDIGEGAFYGCKSLKEAVLPGSIKNIGAYVFRNCINLRVVDWPKQAEMKDKVFDHCNKIEEMHLHNVVSAEILTTSNGRVNRKRHNLFVPKGTAQQFEAMKTKVKNVEYIERSVNGKTVKVPLVSMVDVKLYRQWDIKEE